MSYSSLWISIKTSVVAIAITFVLGIIIAWFVFVQNNKKIKMILDGFFTLPLVLPPTVAGFFLLYLFGVNRPIGQFFINVFNFKIPFSWWATVIAAVFMSFPLMYRSALGAFEQVNKDLLDAARTLGMKEKNIFFKVVFPNAKPGILSGSILAFARGLGEFGATSMLAGNIDGQTRTLPMAVYSFVSSGDYKQAGQYVIILVILAFISVFIMNGLSVYKERR